MVTWMRLLRKPTIYPEGMYRVPAVSHAPIEPHVCVVEPDMEGGLTLWASEQGGVRYQQFVCDLFGYQPSKVRFITPYIGGAFGAKCDLLVTPIAVMLAMKSKHAVRLEMSREEVFVHGDPRGSAIVWIKDGIMKDGTIVARQIKEILDGGAYSGYVTGFVHSLVQNVLQTLRYGIN